MTSIPGVPAAASHHVVLCCGLTTMDVVQRVERLPAPNEKTVARSVSVTFGGPAANAAATIVALGLPARLVTAIGSGTLAELVRAEVTGAGVEVTDLAARTTAAPAVSTVLVTEATGDRAVISVNATPVGALPPPDADVLDDVVVVLVDGHHLATAIAVATRARAAGVPVVLDGGSWKPGLERLLPLVDYAIVSADFAVPAGVADGAEVRGDGRTEAARDDARQGGHDGVGQGLEVVAALGPRAVARTHGAAPIRYLEPLVGPDLGTLTVPLDPSHRVVDSIGAGDVFHGAFAAFVARCGGPVDLARGLAFAAGVASLSVRHAGARGWVPAYRSSPAFLDA